MVAEQGGPTAQSGILYQNSIAALYLGRLLDTRSRPLYELVKKVRVEAPFSVDDVVVTHADDHKHYIHVKENVKTGDKAWKDVWKDFNRQFNKPEFNFGQDRLVFWIGYYGSNHDELIGLSKRCEGSKSSDEWWNSLNIKQKTLSKKIRDILSLDLMSDDSFFDFMKHVHIEVMPPNTIERDYVPVWMPKTNMKPIVLFHLLRDRVGGNARIRAEFTATTLRNLLLNEVDVLRFAKSTSINQLRKSIRDCGAVLLQHKHTLGKTGHHIVRPIVKDIVNWIEGNNDFQKNVSMLIDDAGMGKTVVLHDVLVDLLDKKIDVLAIKADQQLLGLKSFEEIHRNLSINDPIFESIERLAKINKVAIIIDQIDALSLSLAHDQQTLDSVLELIARLRRIHNVNVVISCRLFDLNNDPRFRLIEYGKEFNIPKLSHDEIHSALSLVNIRYEDLSSITMELLRVPLHLDLFIRVIDSYSGSDSEKDKLININSVQDLYEMIWNRIIFKDLQGKISTSHRKEVITLLTTYMDENQHIYVPDSIFLSAKNDHLKDSVNWLASEGIIVNRNSTWTFLHQTFFDFCYARDFIEKGKNIVDSIESSNQGLFDRPKIIQVLSYLRVIKGINYLEQFNGLLGLDSLRYHLRDHIIRWFGSLPDPLEEEWNYARTLFLTPDNRRILFSEMKGNKGWFSYLKDGVLPSWLESEEEQVTTEVVPYLMSMFAINQIEIVSLIEPYLGKNEIWNDRIRMIISVKNISTLEAADLYEKYFKETFSLEGNVFMRSGLYEIGLLAKFYPKISCRLIRFVLDKILEKINKIRTQHQEIIYSSSLIDDEQANLHSEFMSLENSMFDDAFFLCSQNEPKYYVELILPWLISALNTYNKNNKSGYWYRKDALSHNWHNNLYKVQSTIIHSLIDSLQKIASSNKEYFFDCINSLKEIELSTPQQLIALVYVGIPEIYSEEALLFLLDDTRRLKLGDYGQSYTRKLINAIFTFLDSDNRILLEKYIVAYTPIHKSRGLAALKFRGIEQYRFLLSVPFDMLSLDGKKILRELKHKFPDVEQPMETLNENLSLQTIGPPIPLENAKKMSDRNWINAFKKYQKSFTHTDFYKGGAYELSTLLQRLIKETPQRFWNLFTSIDFRIDDPYAIAFIQGFADTEDAPAEWLFESVRHFSKENGRQIQRPIAWAIKKRVSDNIPDDIVDLLTKIIYSNNIEDEETWSEGNDFQGPFNRYLNSDRGASFDTLMRIYSFRGDEKSMNQKWTLLEFAASDRSTAIRAGAIFELIYMIQDNRKKAFSIFEKLIKGNNVLFDSEHTREFLYWALKKNYLRLEKYLKLMMNRPGENAQQQGAELACIAYISTGALESPKAMKRAKVLAEKAYNGQITWKRGAARIFIHNLSREPGHICKPYAINLISEEDEKIRTMIDNIFLSIKDKDVIPLRDFIEEYSKSGRGFNHSFTDFLWKTCLIDAQWTLEIIKIILSNKTDETKNLWERGVEELIRAVLQIYQSPITDKNTKIMSMDTFDTLMKKYSIQSLDVLSKWDKR